MIPNFNSTPIKNPPITRPNCGTIGGGKSHRWRNESFCEPCYEAKRVYNRAQYKKHSTKIIESTERYRKANLDKQQKWSAKYRANNLEKVRETNRKYANSMPEKRRQRERKRRALKFKNGHVPYTESQALELYGKTCHLCNLPIDLTATRQPGKPGWERGLHIDHVVPLANGGPDIIENVRPAHGLCNLRKGAKMGNIQDEFEPELDEDLFDEEFDAEDVELEDYDAHALDEEDEDWEDS